MPSSVSSFFLVDKAKKGKLSTELRKLRAEGKSLDAMSRYFEAQGFSVSRETIRRWCQDAGLSTGKGE